MYSYSELQFLYNHQNHIYKCICICLGAATMELSNIWPRQPRFTQEARDYHHRTNKAQIGNKLKKHEGRYDNIIILMCCFLFFPAVATARDSFKWQKWLLKKKRTTKSTWWWRKEQSKFHWCAWEVRAVEVRAASMIITIIGSGENNQETLYTLLHYSTVVVLQEHNNLLLFGTKEDTWWWLDLFLFRESRFTCWSTFSF